MYNVNETDFSKTIWGQKIIAYTRKIIAEVLEELKILEDELIDIPEAVNYFHTIQDDILLISALRNNNFKWDDYYNEFSKIEFSKLTRAPKLDEDTRNRVKEVREKAKDLIGKKLRDDIYISTSSEILNDIKLAYKHANSLYKIVELFDIKFNEKKAEKNVLDFSDLEHLCLKLFSENEDVVLDYKKKYEEVLIDEYQDSNLIQENILNMIANDNVFMVGDVKQSIYKFRKARPEIFLEKYNKFPEYNNEVERIENKILLFKNFRSNQNIIDDINFIFNNIMSEDVAEIEYDEKEYLKFGSEDYNYLGDNAELHLIEKTEDKDEFDEPIPEEIDEKAELEARVIAKRIEELVGKFEIFDKKTRAKRKTKYSDIVVLLRATKEYANIFYDELSSRNIPVYTETKQGYFDNTEVQVMLSLLKIIDNPYQDIPLISVLKSEIGGFDVTELTKIRLYDRNVSYYDALQLAALQDEKVKRFINRLNTWREKSRYVVIDELLSYLYDETGYYYFVSLLPGGKRRQSNLKELLKKASDYGKSTFKGLYNFLNFIENVKLTSRRYGLTIYTF